MVTAHALHLMSLISNHHNRSKSLIDPSDMFHLIFGTMLPTSPRTPHPNYSSLSQRPSFEHAGLIFYIHTHLPSRFNCLSLSLKLTFSENLILHLSLISVCRTDLMAVDGSPDLFAHRFYVLVLFFCFSYS